jgi:predicted regulator of Ras-like GTPase activity (Roadblock/LC7/MglB family)
VPLSQVIHDWPAEVRQEINGLNVGAMQLALPMSLLEQALRNGQVQFAWRQICGWLEPAVSFAPAPETAEVLLDLPLKVVAPLFLARHQPTAAQRRIQVSAEIPDVFGKREGGWAVVPPSAGTVGTASAPAASQPAPAATPGSSKMVAGAAAKASEVVFDVNAVLGPPSQRLTAKEIVANTSKLPGAVGALLAMSDGLLVTSSAPPQVKGEVVAAFLPQIFGRMGQYTKELNMGSLRGITFAVEGGNWQFVKEPNIYFAVLCRPDKALPLAHLATLAAELNKQQQ